MYDEDWKTDNNTFKYKPFLNSSIKNKKDFDKYAKENKNFFKKTNLINAQGGEEYFDNVSSSSNASDISDIFNTLDNQTLDTLNTSTSFNSDTETLDTVDTTKINDTSSDAFAKRFNYHYRPNNKKYFNDSSLYTNHDDKRIYEEFNSLKNELHKIKVNHYMLKHKYDNIKPWIIGFLLAVVFIILYNLYHNFKNKI